MQPRKSNLLRQKPQVINIGLELFSDALKQQNAKVVHVAWRPPADGNAKLIKMLNKLL